MKLELKVPEVGESITEVEIGDWLKPKGAQVRKDEPIVALESEKATVELPAPEAGTITETLKQKGETAKVGEVIAFLETDGQAALPKAPEKKPSAKAPEPAPEPKPAAKASEPGPEAKPAPKPPGEPRACRRRESERVGELRL